MLYLPLDDRGLLWAPPNDFVLADPHRPQTRSLRLRVLVPPERWAVPVDGSRLLPGRQGEAFNGIALPPEQLPSEAPEVVVRLEAFDLGGERMEDERVETDAGSSALDRSVNREGDRAH